MQYFSFSSHDIEEVEKGKILTQPIHEGCIKAYSIQKAMLALSKKIPEDVKGLIIEEVPEEVFLRFEQEAANDPPLI
jgi:hypothetical protein